MLKVSCQNLDYSAKKQGHLDASKLHYDRDDTFPGLLTPPASAKEISAPIIYTSSEVNDQPAEHSGFNSRSKSRKSKPVRAPMKEPALDEIPGYIIRIQFGDSTGTIVRATGNYIPLHPATRLVPRSNVIKKTASPKLPKRKRNLAKGDDVVKKRVRSHRAHRTRVIRSDDEKYSSSGELDSQ
jgi:hypothetical protein